MRILTLFLAQLFCIFFNIVYADNWDAKSYQQNSILQKMWADEFFFNKYSFIGNEHVLDIGSGDGKITAKIAEKVPNGKVIGIDKSPSMVADASLKYKSFNKNLNFFQMDAQNRNFYAKHKGQFDLVTSFVTLHWVEKQEEVLSGIKESLKEGGKIYITIASKSPDPIQIIADELAKSTKWSQYFKNFHDPMHRFNKEEYEDLLNKVGLKSISVTDTQYKDLLDSKENLKKQLISWLPHYKFLPANKREEFIDEVVKRYILKFPPNEHGNILLFDYYLHVIAAKP